MIGVCRDNLRLGDSLNCWKVLKLTKLQHKFLNKN
nr:MAG TPA: hypothetical protein [Bacteriophage sp.]